jgi:hypothetical protein
MLRYNYFFVFFSIFFSLYVSAQVKSHTIPKTYHIKEKILLNDSLYNGKGIIFFLNISNSQDSITWVKAINEFSKNSRFKKEDKIKIYSLFYKRNGPNVCNACGVNYNYKSDSVQIYSPTCMLFGYSKDLIDRACEVLKDKGKFKYSSTGSYLNKLAFIEFESLLSCSKPYGGAEIETWDPFINEVFAPNYSQTEQLIILQDKISFLQKQNDELQLKVNEILGYLKAKSKPDPEPKNEKNLKNKQSCFFKKNISIIH